MQNPRPHRRLFTALILALALGPAAAAARAQVTEAEPNHPCTQAQDLGAPSFPVTVSGSLETPPDVPDIDFYRVAVVPGNEVTVRLDRAGDFGVGVGDPLVGVYDADCTTLITYNDDGGGDLNSLARLTAPASGVIVIAATSFADFGFSGQGSYSGAYLVTVEQLAVASSISGRAVDALSSEPLAFAYVELFRCTGGSCLSFTGYTYTDSDGAFRFQSGDYTLFGQPLYTGEYKIIVRAFNHVDAEVGPFYIGAGEDLDLGDVGVLPIPTVNSITGRAVDAVSGAPLPGGTVPFASAELRFCDPYYGYCYWIRGTPTDEQGNFRFDGSSGTPLLAGTYQVVLYADQYQVTYTDFFTVGAAEDHDLGSILVKSFPVRLYLRNSCGFIPSTGGTCRFSVDVVNGMADRFQGQVWSIINAYNPYVFGTSTTFEVDDPRTLVLAPSASATASLRFDVPGDVPDDTLICAQFYAARRPSEFNVLGSHYLFCLYKGYGGFLQVPEERKRELIRSLQGGGRRRNR